MKNSTLTWILEDASLDDKRLIMYGFEDAVMHYLPSEFYNHSIKESIIFAKWKETFPGCTCPAAFQECKKCLPEKHWPQAWKKDKPVADLEGR